MAFANCFFICLIPHSEEKCWNTQSKTLTTLLWLPSEYRVPAKPPFFSKPSIELTPSTLPPLLLYKHQTRKSGTINVLHQKAGWE